MQEDFPADDEARWLSEEESAAPGPIAKAPFGSAGVGSAGVGSAGVGADVGRTVYDIESDGLRAEPSRAEEGPLDLMSAMRSRRREREAGKRTSAGARRSPRPEAAPQVESTGSRPSDVPGSAHPAGRKRPAPEPLELDPTLMDDPPAAHPATSTVQPDPDEAGPSDPAVVTAASVPRRWPLADSMARPGLAPDVGDQVDPEAALQNQTSESQTAMSETAMRQAEDQAAADRHRGSQPAKRGRRASVPSWDDIMFGSKRD